LLDLGVIPDDKAALRDAFVYADAHADVLISSGGVSVGEADYTKAILAELGEVAFWKVAINRVNPLLAVVWCMLRAVAGSSACREIRSRRW